MRSLSADDSDEPHEERLGKDMRPAHSLVNRKGKAVGQMGLLAARNRSGLQGGPLNSRGISRLVILVHRLRLLLTTRVIRRVDRDVDVADGLY